MAREREKKKKIRAGAKKKNYSGGSEKKARERKKIISAGAKKNSCVNENTTHKKAYVP